MIIKLLKHNFCYKKHHYHHYLCIQHDTIQNSNVLKVYSVNTSEENKNKSDRKPAYLITVLNHNNTNLMFLFVINWQDQVTCWTKSRSTTNELHSSKHTSYRIFCAPLPTYLTQKASVLSPPPLPLKAKHVNTQPFVVTMLLISVIDFQLITSKLIDIQQVKDF